MGIRPRGQGILIMSTWNNEQDGQQPSPVDPMPRIVPEIGNANTFATEGSLALAPDAVPLSTAPTPVVALPAAAPAELAPPPSDAPGSDAEDIEQNKVFAIVGYLGILFLVPLLAAPNSKFARYHANQGIVLFIATLVVMFGSFVLGFIPFVGRVVGYLAWIVALVFMILGIVNAANGKCQPLPVIGGYQLLK